MRRVPFPGPDHALDELQWWGRCWDEVSSHDNAPDLVAQLWSMAHPSLREQLVGLFGDSPLACMVPSVRRAVEVPSFVRFVGHLFSHATFTDPRKVFDPDHEPGWSFDLGMLGQPSSQRIVVHFAPLRFVAA